MMPWLPLGFAQPLVLLGLLSLPVLWWLLRLIPPQPTRIDFPPTRLLFDIKPQEETPRRTPWWLTLLRLTLATLVILAAAGPLWNPAAEVARSTSPLALLIDDGFPAAGTWDARMRTADDLINRAETDGRGVALIPLSETGREIGFETPGAARVRLKQIKPKPYAVQRSDALPGLTRFFGATADVETVWLSDGVDRGGGAEFVAALGRLVGTRAMSVIEGGLAPALALAGAENTAGALTVKVLRSAKGGAQSGVIRGLDLKGLPLGEATFSFGANETETEAALTLPVEIRNDVARLDIGAERSAGAVQLLDKRWRRRAVGVVTGATADTAQPLLASTYYLTRALNPFADVRQADRGSAAQAVNQFMDQRLPMMILADVGNVAEARERLTKWIEDGGVLVRFAGPRLAAGDDDLIPVKLRRGGRALGGALSWDQPQQLAAFSRESPFVNMPVPNDVTVSRQVLAEPDATLTDRTWATLADGTPLVTAQARGKGLIILFHVSADTRWSNLPLSGAFVDMLKRIVSLAGSAATADGDGARGGREVVPPTRILDGFGVFGPPPQNARPVAAGYSGRATVDHPPGFYGPPEGLLAVNTLAPDDRLAPLDLAGLNARRDVYRVSEPQDLRGPVMLAAMGLLALDALVVFFLAGGIAQLFRRRPRPAAAALAFAIAAARLMLPQPGQAQDDTAALARDAADTLRLCHHRQRRGRPHQPRRPARPHAVPRATHRARSRRSGRDRSRQGRARVLSADLLADGAGRDAPLARGAGAHRRLHEERRHGAVRHPRRHRGCGRQRRGLAQHAGAAHHPLLARYPGARGGAARPRADQDVLSAQGVSRPLCRRAALGRSHRDRPRRRHAGAPGAHRRRRLLDHHLVERSRRRLGAAAGRPGDAADGRERAAPARIRVPRRRQHRDVHAHRQLQGRSGPRAGVARDGWGSRRVSVNLGISFAPLVPDYLVWSALAVAVVLAILLLASRSRGAFMRAAAMALFVLALANPSFTREDRDPLTSVAIVVVDKSASQEFGDRTKQTEAVRAALSERLGRIPNLEVRFVEAGESGGETDGTRLFTALTAGIERHAARPRRRRDLHHRRARARRADRRRDARLRRPGACADHRPPERARPPRGAGHDAALRHRRAVADHRLPRRGPGRAGRHRRK